MGIYAPQINPYAELTMLPTADICPCVERKKFTTDDRAVPKSTRRITSKNRYKTSVPDIYQPSIATYPRHRTIAQRETINVDMRFAT